MAGRCGVSQEALDGHLHFVGVSKGGSQGSGRWLPSTQ